MAENLLKEVLRYCKINKESLVKLLTTLGVNNYITICELKSKSFINKISELTEEEFDEIFLCKVGESEPDDDQSLKELNKQVSNKKYSQTLKDFSVLVRLQVGRQIYQLLSNNLPLPKTKTTDHYLQQYEYVNEGELQLLDVVLEVFNNGGSDKLDVPQPPSALPTPAELLKNKS